MIESGFVGAGFGEAPRVEPGSSALPADEQASAEIFGALLAAFTAMDSSASPAASSEMNAGGDLGIQEIEDEPGLSSLQLPPVKLAPPEDQGMTLASQALQGDALAGDAPVEQVSSATFTETMVSFPALPEEDFAPAPAGDTDVAKTSDARTRTLPAEVASQTGTAPAEDRNPRAHRVDADSMDEAPTLSVDGASVDAASVDAASLDAVDLDAVDLDAEFFLAPDGTSAARDNASTKLDSKAQSPRFDAVEFDDAAKAEADRHPSEGEPSTAPAPARPEAKKSPRAQQAAERAGASAPSPARLDDALLTFTDAAVAPRETRDAPAASLPGSTHSAPTFESLPRATPLEAPSTGPHAAHHAAEPRAASLSWTPEIRHELAAKAREFLQHGETEIRFTLDPPEMGKLSVRLEISEHRVSATITATSTATAALLERDRSDLVRAFEAQGIEDVQVRVGAERDAHPQHPGAFQEPEREADLESAPYVEPAHRSIRPPTSVVDCFV